MRAAKCFTPSPNFLQNLSNLPDPGTSQSLLIEHFLDSGGTIGPCELSIEEERAYLREALQIEQEIEEFRDIPIPKLKDDLSPERHFNDSVIALDILYDASRKSAAAAKTLRSVADLLVRQGGNLTIQKASEAS